MNSLFFLVALPLVLATNSTVTTNSTVNSSFNSSDVNDAGINNSSSSSPEIVLSNENKTNTSSSSTSDIDNGSTVNSSDTNTLSSASSISSQTNGNALPDGGGDASSPGTTKVQDTAHADTDGSGDQSASNAPINDTAKEIEGYVTRVNFDETAATDTTNSTRRLTVSAESCAAGFKGYQTAYMNQINKSEESKWFMNMFQASCTKSSNTFTLTVAFIFHKGAGTQAGFKLAVTDPDQQADLTNKVKSEILKAGFDASMTTTVVAFPISDSLLNELVSAGGSGEATMVIAAVNCATAGVNVDKHNFPKCETPNVDLSADFGIKAVQVHSCIAGTTGKISLYSSSTCDDAADQIFVTPGKCMKVGAAWVNLRCNDNTLDSKIPASLASEFAALAAGGGSSTSGAFSSRGISAAVIVLAIVMYGF